MNFRPIHDRILVLPVKTEEMIGSIIIPEVAQEEKEMGCVVASGPGAIQNDGGIRTMSVRVGEVVIYQKYAGFEIELETDSVAGKLKYKVIQEEEVLGILEEATDEGH